MEATTSSVGQGREHGRGTSCWPIASVADCWAGGGTGWCGRWVLGRRVKQRWQRCLVDFSALGRCLSLLLLLSVSTSPGLLNFPRPPHCG